MVSQQFTPVLGFFWPPGGILIMKMHERIINLFKW